MPPAATSAAAGRRLQPGRPQSRSAAWARARGVAAPLPPCRLNRKDVAGFSYIGVLLLMAGFGIALAATGELWSTLAQRERETELLAVGQAYQQAIQSYHAASKPGTRPLPSKLEDLLEDRRQSVMQRHLRKLYLDPLTGSADWALIRGPDGSITGLHSRATGTPRRSSFAPPFEAFAKAESYADWRFEFKPPQRTSLPAPVAR